MRVLFFPKKWLLFLWIMLGILLLMLYFVKSREDIYAPVFATPARGKTIVLDAGHGGFDPGAVSPRGVKEDKINLLIVRKLRDYLIEHGVTVIMTRDSDSALAPKKSQDMQKRVEIIRESHADMIVSIHLNKFSQSQYYGAQTFYMTGSEAGERLAENIQQQLISNLGRGNKRQIKAVSNLLILKVGSAPSVIVECGFLSNPEEEGLLNTTEYQDQIAWSIYAGIIGYFALEENDNLTDTE